MIKNLVGGQLVATESGRSQPVYNPATGEAIDELGLSSTDEINAAVDIAAAAFPAWSSTPPLKRAAIMFRFNELLIKNADAVAREISREHGKTHDDALGEVQRGREVVEFVCGIPQLLKGEFSRNVGPQIDSWSDRQALGVCAGITPFNFPAMVPLWMYPVAIACGNTFVLKPSERDPSAVMKLSTPYWTTRKCRQLVLSDQHRLPNMSIIAGRRPASEFKPLAVLKTTWLLCRMQI